MRIVLLSRYADFKKSIPSVNPLTGISIICRYFILRLVGNVSKSSRISGDTRSDAAGICFRQVLSKNNRLKPVSVLIVDMQAAPQSCRANHAIMYRLQADRNSIGRAMTVSMVW
jgi:hypothetical protein